MVLLDLDFVKKIFFIFSIFIPFLFSYFIALAGSPTEVVALTAALCLVVDVNVLTVCTFFFFFGYITWLVGSYTPTRDGTLTPYIGISVLTSGPPGTSLSDCPVNIHCR